MEGRNTIFYISYVSNIVILNYNAAACSLETRRDMGHFDARRSTLAPSLLACRICVWTSAVPPAILYIWLNSTRMHLLQPLAAAGATYHVQVCLDQVASKLGSTVTVSFSEQNSAYGFLLPELKPL